MDHRDDLQEIIELAQAKNFDILLVFMFDRIGRRNDETSIFTLLLDQSGIQIWSVQEGVLDFEKPDQRIAEFGDTAVIILNPDEFLQRMLRGLENQSSGPLKKTELWIDTGGITATDTEVRDGAGQWRRSVRGDCGRQGGYIRKWFLDGVERGHRHMLIVYDRMWHIRLFSPWLPTL